MTARAYTGIGSRQTPLTILKEMEALAGELAAAGWTLRSGGADGADSAFEQGARATGGPLELYLPWRGFNGRRDGIVMGHDLEAAKIAATLHPAWNRLPQGAAKLHTRNVPQVLGRDLASPSAFVLCWTADGCIDEKGRTRDTGGTGTAITLASRRGVPVLNLQRGVAECRAALRDLMTQQHAGTESE